jgi:GT2 family glycosyltransferase
MQLDLSIIIVNYNGKKYVEDCVESIQKTTIGLNYEIIILDNDSKDESCTFIKKYFPHVQLIESKINYGFGKGNNEAFKRANGTFILLLNNDTILLNQLLPVINHLREDDSIGAIGIEMLNGNQEILPAFGNFPSLANMFLMKKIQNNKAKKQEQFDVDWLTGSFVLMPRKVYEVVNGFDEDYFLYVEDVDLCRRIANANYRRVFFPQYKYIHFVGFNASRNPLLVKGYEIYITKHFSGLYKDLISFALGINKCVKRVKQFLNHKQ